MTKTKLAKLAAKNAAAKSSVDASHDSVIAADYVPVAVPVAAPPMPVPIPAEADYAYLNSAPGQVFSEDVEAFNKTNFTTTELATIKGQSLPLELSAHQYADGTTNLKDPQDPAHAFVPNITALTGDAGHLPDPIGFSNDPNDLLFPSLDDHEVSLPDDGGLATTELYRQFGLDEELFPDFIQWDD